MNVGAEKWEEEQEKRDKNCKQKEQQQAGNDEGGGVAGKFSILLGKSTRQEAP